MTLSTRSKLFHYVTKIFGLNPFEDKNDIKISMTDYLYTIFLVVCSTIDFSIAFRDMIVDEKVEKAFFLISLMLKAVDYVFIVTSWLKPLIFCATKQSIQMSVEKVNYLLKCQFQDQTEPNSDGVRVEQRQITLLILTGISYHFLFLWAQKEGYLFKTTTTILLHFSYYVVLILAFQVKKDLHTVKRQFERVNYEVGKLAETTDVIEKDAPVNHLHYPDNEKAGALKKMKIPSNLQLGLYNEFIAGVKRQDNHNMALREKVICLNRIHFEICRTFNKISLYYSCEALISTARITAYSVVPLYFIITAFLVPGSQKKSKVGTLIYYANFLWANYYSIGSFIVSSMRTACEGNNISSVIHDWLDTEMPPIVADELEMFSLQLIQRKIKFSILQLFSMTPSLLLSISEQVATYVLILLQFQQSKITSGTASV